jgi:hypothetical protein
MWLEHPGAHRSWISLWWLDGLMSIHSVRSKLATATWACALSGRILTCGRVSDAWLRQHDLESRKHQGQL